MPIPIFDLDGTLIDSDAALLAAFAELGIDPESVTFGHVLADECARLGLSVDDYVAAYDVDAAKPYAGVDQLVNRLDRWAVCSNKDPRSATGELRRLGWRPEAALFSDAFEGGKEVTPVLERLGVPPGQAVFVGDTEHDRRCAAAAGVRFALAGWNPRALTIARPSDVVLVEPIEVLSLLS